MTETELPSSSAYAEELAATGVRPLTVTQDDLDKMLAQMNALQAKVDQMNVERGVPVDRVDGYRRQLEAHLKLHTRSRQDTDFTLAQTAVDALPGNPDEITASHTEALHFTVEQWLKQHPGKELDYIGILAGELHQSVLEREGKHGVMHQRVQELEAQTADLMAQLSALKGAQTVPLDKFAALEAKVSALLAETANG